LKEGFSRFNMCKNFSRTQKSIAQNRFLVRINSVVVLILWRGEGGPKNEVDSSFKNDYLRALDPILVSYSIPLIEFSSHNPSLNARTASTTEERVKTRDKWRGEVRVESR
jgi:hypothetical protein